MAESKTALVYKRVLEDILRLKFKFDTPINEKDIAEKYCVSKTPAHEALTLLAENGVLKKLPRFGYFINEISGQEYYKLLFLRFTLEKGVILNIIRSCTDDEIKKLYDSCTEEYCEYEDYALLNLRFHSAMADVTKNEFLRDAVERVFYRMVRAPSYYNYEAWRKAPHRRHRKLIEALLKRDESEAIAILRDECRRDDDVELWF